MRNNFDRFSAQPPENQSPPASAVESQQTGGVFSFAIPTEFVDLPSKGMYYPEGHPLCNVDTVEIRHMTAKDEDILTSESLIRKGIVLDRLLQSVLVDKSIDIDSLLIGDKNALLIACRKYGYGVEFPVQTVCPSCGHEGEHGYDISQWKEKEINLEEFDVKKTESNTFIVVLPTSNVSVEFKLLNSYDVKVSQELMERNKKLNLPNTAATDFLVLIIQSVNGFADQVSIKNFVDNVPAIDSTFLRTVFSSISPDIVTSSEFSCESCEYKEVVAVPLDVSFFWPNG